jgi:hypothetical protein
MDMTLAPDKMVVVRAGALDDLIQLASRVVETSGRIVETDPLLVALRGAIGEVRAHSAIEP